jgi:hypothetical protein
VFAALMADPVAEGAHGADAPDLRAAALSAPTPDWAAQALALMTAGAVSATADAEAETVAQGADIETDAAVDPAVVAPGLAIASAFAQAMEQQAVDVKPSAETSAPITMAEAGAGGPTVGPAVSVDGRAVPMPGEPPASSDAAASALEPSGAGARAAEPVLTPPTRRMKATDAAPVAASAHGLAPGADGPEQPAVETIVALPTGATLRVPDAPVLDASPETALAGLVQAGFSDATAQPELAFARATVDPATPDQPMAQRPAGAVAQATMAPVDAAASTPDPVLGASQGPSPHTAEPVRDGVPLSIADAVPVSQKEAAAQIAYYGLVRAREIPDAGVVRAVVSASSAFPDAPAEGPSPVVVTGPVSADPVALPLGDTAPAKGNSPPMPVPVVAEPPVVETLPSDGAARAGSLIAVSEAPVSGEGSAPVPIAGGSEGATPATTEPLPIAAAPERLRVDAPVASAPTPKASVTLAVSEPSSVPAPSVSIPTLPQATAAPIGLPGDASTAPASTLIAASPGSMASATQMPIPFGDPATAASPVPVATRIAVQPLAPVEAVASADGETEANTDATADVAEVVADERPAMSGARAAGPVMTAALQFAQRLARDPFEPVGAETDTLMAVAGGSVGSVTATLVPDAVRADLGARPDAPTIAIPMLAVEVARQGRAGLRNFDIRLDPPELGTVHVKLDIAKDGDVRVHMIVERKDTLDMLLADKRTLERTLEQAGVRTESGSGLQFSLRQDGGGQSPGQGQGQAYARDVYRSGVRSDAREADLAAADIAAALTSSAARRGGLDLRI